MSIKFLGRPKTFSESGTRVLLHVLTICSLVVTSQLAWGQGVDTKLLTDALEDGVVNIDETDPSKKYLKALIDRIEDGEIKFDETDPRSKSEKDYHIFRAGLLEGLQAGIKSFATPPDSQTDLKAIIKGIQSNTTNIDRANPTKIYLEGVIEGLAESHKSIIEGDISQAVLIAERDAIKNVDLSFRAVFNDVYYSPNAKSPLGIMVPTDLDDTAVSNNPDIPKNDSIAELLVHKRLRLVSPEVRQRYHRMEAAMRRNRQRSGVIGKFKVVKPAPWYRRINPF